MERLVLHEYHVAHLQASHEVLNGWSKIATASPDIFNEGDFVGMDFKGFSQPSIVKLNAFVFEEDVLLRKIEDLLPKHNEARIVPACDSDII